MRLTVLLFALGLGLAAPLARADGASDVEAFKMAAGLVQAGDWVAAEAAVAEAGPIARDLVRWLRLRDGPRAADAAPDPRDPDPVFADYAAFLAAYPHWPGLERLRMQGERTIPPDAAPEAVLGYFTGVKPQTGEGVAALARALAALGRVEEARAAAAEGWMTVGLSDETQTALLASWGETLRPMAWDRAQEMLWRWRTGDAERLLPLLSDDQRALALARIALIRDAGDLDARVAAVPEALRDDPGLAVDRFNRLAEDGDYTDAVALLLARTDDAARMGQPFRWASWRAVLARWALREGRPDEAYRLASRHHLTGENPGTDFYADLEWIAGYVALRHLDDPAAALTHFRRMQAAVSGPISTARAAYWTARAEEAAGSADAAAQSYARAAQYQTAFYGLLAAERLGLPFDASLAVTEGFGDWRQGAVLRSDLTAALLMLVAGGDRDDAVLFAARLGQTLDRADLGQLGGLLTDTVEPFLTLVVAKAALERGISIPQMLYPIHPMAAMDLPVDRDLALSIARQESEFNAAAGSGVGALGLMQLMPGTAEEVAGDLGLAYDRGRLTGDWQYNATLGSAYLAELQARFGPTPVMVAAGYNAGPARPSQWIALRGDPRIGGADVIDWIEMIPFAETRNYVMRVTEAMPVYRARLTGSAGTVGFLDMLRGEKPLLRPVARGEQTVFDTDQAVAAVLQGLTPETPVAAGTASLAPSQSLRPVARP